MTKPVTPMSPMTIFAGRQYIGQIPATVAKAFHLLNDGVCPKCGKEIVTAKCKECGLEIAVFTGKNKVEIEAKVLDFVIDLETELEG